MASEMLSKTSLSKSFIRDKANASRKSEKAIKLFRDKLECTLNRKG